jgi:hypothetical protein
MKILPLFFLFFAMATGVHAADADSVIAKDSSIQVLNFEIIHHGIRLQKFGFQVKNNTGHLLYIPLRFDQLIVPQMSSPHQEYYRYRNALPMSRRARRKDSAEIQPLKPGEYLYIDLKPYFHYINNNHSPNIFFDVEITYLSDSFYTQEGAPADEGIQKAALKALLSSESSSLHIPFRGKSMDFRTYSLRYGKYKNLDNWFKRKLWLRNPVVGIVYDNEDTLRSLSWTLIIVQKKGKETGSPYFETRNQASGSEFERVDELTEIFSKRRWRRYRIIINSIREYPPPSPGTIWLPGRD